MTQQVRQQFTAALESLVEEVKRDRSILAALLCGSLSHDTVWARSDIDLVLVTIDDKHLKSRDMALYADGVNVHAMLFSRAELRAAIDGTAQNSFMHSFLAKGRLLYTHDESIAAMCSRLSALGERDMQIALFSAATAALPAVYKAHKWLITRGDLEYAALWILYAATALARVEVISARQLADREVLPQAMTINPEFFRRIYVDLLNSAKTRPAVTAALDAVDSYLETRIPRLFAPLLRYLRDAGEPRSCSELEDYFQRHFDVCGVVTACEYLADQGWIGKASLPAQLTRKSNTQTQELAFFDTGGNGRGSRQP